MKKVMVLLIAAFFISPLLICVPKARAAADWKQYFKQPYATFYYDANSIQRSGDVVQVTTLTKFNWPGIGVENATLKKIDHSIELLEINCRSKTRIRKRITNYKADGSVIYDHRFTESDGYSAEPHSIEYSSEAELLYHIVCGS